MLYFYRYCYYISINVINTNKDHFAVLFNRFIYTLQCVIGDSFGQLVSVCSSQRAWSLSAENFAETLEILWSVNYRCCLKL